MNNNETESVALTLEDFRAIGDALHYRLVEIRKGLKELQAHVTDENRHLFPNYALNVQWYENKIRALDQAYTKLHLVEWKMATEAAKNEKS